MKLIKLIAKKVHGYLEFNIHFNEQLTFLSGINGSGKTTALKLIVGLIQPSFQFLNDIKYDYAELTFIDENIDCKCIISSRPKDENKLVLMYKCGDEEPIEDTFDTFPKVAYDEDIYDDNIREKLLNYINAFDEKPVVAKIKELGTPFYLGLDRRTYLSERNVTFRQFQRQRRDRFFKARNFKDLLYSASSSLMEVQELVFDYFRSMANRQSVISEQFKNKLLEESFNYIDVSILDRIDILLKADDIENKKKSTLKAIEDLNLNYLSTRINDFYDQMLILSDKLGNLLEKSKKSTKSDELFNVSRIWFSNIPQLNRIGNIISLSQEYQSQITLLHEPINRLETIINNFLKESKKSFKVESDGVIQISLPNNTIKSIFELSSGEIQIVTMISHLIFSEYYKNTPKIFIIDEPELSLHLAWQEIFVDSILEASPKTQFILATHSPSIISKMEREELCVDLSY